MTTAPAVSLYSSVYNNRDFIEETVRSVLAQDFEDFEHVIVDDGSTDGTSDILADLARADRRIRLIRQDNSGIARASNRALSECRAPLVARIDGDDLAHPSRLRSQVEFMGARDVVCIGSHVQIIDERSRPLTILRIPTEDHEIQQHLLRGQASIFHTSMMARADAVRAVGGYDERFAHAEDLDLLLRLGEAGPLANVPEPLMSYRIHAGSECGANSQGVNEMAKRACEEAWRRRGVEGEFIPPSWRPDTSSGSAHPFLCRYGWWAHQNGHQRTALIYGAKAIFDRPLEPEGWKLLASAAARSAARNEWRKSA